VRRVVDQASRDLAAEDLRQDTHHHEPEEQAIREREVRRVAHGVEVLRAERRVRTTRREHVESVLGVLELLGIDGARAIEELAADEMAEADRAGVRHDRDRAGGDAPLVRGGAVVDLLDRLQLDEVVASADRADL
jgi:hypothetical protein